MKKFFSLVFFVIFCFSFVGAQDLESSEANDIHDDFIIHYKRFIFDSFDTFQFASLAENPPKVALSNRELYKIVLTVDGNEKLVKRAKIWKGIGYVFLCSFAGTGIGYYCTHKDSDAEMYTGALCLLSLLSIPITNQISVSYKMQAIDNYNLSLLH